MNAVSLFAGVGGFECALESNGIPVVASVEIDKNARQILARHFPKSQLFNDVRKVTGDDLRRAGFIPDGGIITAGFPCQDLSVAGRRRGLAGERSGLFFDIIRLAQETDAEWLVLENVPGLLSSHKGRDMGTVLGALGDSGYGWAYRVLDSRYFGVPQRRRRVFIVARRAGDWRSCAKVLFERESVRGDSSQIGGEGESVAGGITVGTLGCSQGGADDNDARLGHPRMGTGGNNVPLVVHATQTPVVAIDETFALGTSSQQAFIKIIRSGARDDNGNLPPEVWREEYTSPTLNQFGQSSESRTPVLLTMREGKDGGGKGPLLCENMSLTLATGNGQTLFYRGVRRLTPIECERLQGFPDGWTALRLDGSPMPDSQRYKQMGNAVAVPVVQWVIEGVRGAQ